MKALAERILNHPLKVVKCFHMPKLLAVEKIFFFGIIPEEIFPQCNHPAGGKNLIQRKYCMQICLLRICQRIHILHGN